MQTPDEVTYPASGFNDVEYDAEIARRSKII
jgi:hypothetical protein